MMRRKKESGFTLIELMIVIAVIGILAVVLIPKMTDVKTQAKSTGIDTNMKSLELYVNSKIDNALSVDGITTGDFELQLIAAFPASGNDAIANPFYPKKGALATLPTSGPNAAVYVPSASTTAYSLPADDSDLAGMIEVYSVKDGANNIREVYLVPFDKDGKVISTKVKTIKP